MSTSFAGVRNFAVGAVLVLVAQGLRRTHTTKGGHRVPSEGVSPATSSDGNCDVIGGARENNWADALDRELHELMGLADQIYDVASFARHEDEVGEDTFVRLDDLRWILGSYVIKGGRIRRLIQLPDLLESLAVEAHTDTAADSVGSTATELLHRIQDTNSVTIDWLLAHRAALPDPDFLDSNALLDRYNRLEIEPTTVSGDPLYLLACHIHDMLETTAGFGSADHSQLDRLEAQLAKPVIAIENEIKAAIAFNDALLTAAHEVVHTSSGGLAV